MYKHFIYDFDCSDSLVGKTTNNIEIRLKFNIIFDVIVLERRFGLRIPVTTGGFEIKTANTLACNTKQNTWDKIEKPSKTGQAKNKFDI